MSDPNTTRQSQGLHQNGDHRVWILDAEPVAEQSRHGILGPELSLEWTDLTKHGRDKRLLAMAPIREDE